MSDPSDEEPQQHTVAERPILAPTSSRLRKLRQELADKRGFVEELYAITPRVFVTPALLVINIGVFVVMVFAGADVLDPSVETLVAWGANYGPATLAGEWWRVITCMFLHIGLLHLAINMYVLKDVGTFVERLVGNAGFGVLYITSGIMASLTSVWSHPVVVSAGASGAVFGVIGALLGLVMVGHGAIPVGEISRLRRSLLTFLAVNVLFGMLPGIDLAAHMGGFVFGFLGGILLYRRSLLETPVGRAPRNLALAGVGVAAALAMFALVPDDIVRSRQHIEAFVETESRCVATMEALVMRHGAGDLDDAGFAEAVDSQVLAPWRASRLQLAEPLVLPQPVQDHRARVLHYATLREEGWELLARAVLTDDGALLEDARERLAEADRVVQQVNDQQPAG